jgi:Spy/CpxP family protein refolding chaperone
MDIFAQNKLLVRVVIALAVLNVLSIGIFLWKGFSHPPGFPHHPPHGYRDVTGILKRELKLTDTQAEQIDKLRSDYFEKEKMVLGRLRAERDSMNAEMFNKSTDEALVLSLAREISENEYKMEMLRFEQAKELKTICTPDQLEKFNVLMGEIRDYFRPNNQPPGK